MTLATRYAAALKGALGNEAEVFYYASNFGKLWSDGVKPGGQTVVIVWGGEEIGTSADDWLLAKHLTPLDWALDWTMKTETARRIVIIDATAGGWQDTWAWSIRYQLLADMPWVTLAAPLVRKEDEGLYRWIMTPAVMDMGGVDQSEPRMGDVIRKVGLDWKLDAGSAKTPNFDALKMLNKLWVASLSLSDKHHDVNNIVGIRVLMETSAIETALLERDIGLPDQTPVVTAFLARFRWSGFTQGDWIPWKLPNPEYLYGETISALLVDDKHASGWDAFLGAALGPQVEVTARSTTEVLIEFLNVQKRTFERRDFTARVIKPNGESGDRPEIIFLDLRLYGPGDAVRMRSDVGKLLSVAEKWKGEFPAWKPIPPSDLVDIKNWLTEGGSTTDDRYQKALLLLPRLLALALPLTPIILFSATGQARLREALKPYRNIFTGFQKPNPLADPKSVLAALSALHQALDSAAPMLRRRLQLAYVQRIYDKLEAKRPAVRPSKHFEIYFDESGSGDQLISTAVVGVFADKTAADTVQQKFISEFSKIPTPGISWAKRRNTGHSRRLKKAEEFFDGGPDSWSSRIKDNTNLLGEITGDLKLNIISARAKRADAKSEGRKGTLGKFVDHKRLDEAIRLKLEMSLLVLFGYTNRIDSVGIFMQTKSSPISDKIELFETKRYFDKGMAFPLVRAWLQMWGEKYRELASMILSIRSQTLSTKRLDTHLSIAQFSERRALHDIADWGAAFVGFGGEIESYRTKNIRSIFGGCVFNKLYYSDFNLSNCEILSDTLRSLVSNAQPYTARAIGLLCSAPLVESVGGQTLPKVWRSEPQEYYWLWAIFPYISKAIGADLLSGLDGEMARQTDGSPSSL